MDFDEITNICNWLNLDENDGPIMRMKQNVYEKFKERIDLCLVGKVMASKMINRDASERVMNLA